NADTLWVCFHKLDGRAYRVVHVHHRQTGIFLKKASVSSFLHCAEIDVDCIVGGAATRSRLVADKTRKSQTSDVDAIAGEIPSTPAFAGNLADTVDGGWIGNGVLRSIVLR